MEKRSTELQGSEAPGPSRHRDLAGIGCRSRTADEVDAELLSAFQASTDTLDGVLASTISRVEQRFVPIRGGGGNRQLQAAFQQPVHVQPYVIAADGSQSDELLLAAYAYVRDCTPRGLV